MIIKTLTLGEIVENDVNIFDFNYPFYKEELRSTFQDYFIKYFYFEEIAHETVARFKHNLEIKLNLVMPYYNELYMSQDLEQRILDNYDVTEEFERTTNDNISGNGNSINKTLYKTAPKTKIDIDKIDIVDSINKDENNNTFNNNNTGSEKWKRTMKGNIGVQTDADAIMKYWQSLRKVTQELFENELSELFMGVY